MSRKRLRSLNAVKMSLESSFSRLKTKVVLYTYQTTKNKGKKFGVICTLKYMYNFNKNRGRGTRKLRV